MNGLSEVFLCVAVVKATFGFCWWTSSFVLSVEGDFRSKISN